MFPCKSYAVGIAIWCKLNYIGCTIWSIYLYIHWSNDCLMKSIPTSSSYSYHLQVIFHMWWCCLDYDKQLPPPLLILNSIKAPLRSESRSLACVSLVCLRYSLTKMQKQRNLTGYMVVKKSSDEYEKLPLMVMGLCRCCPWQSGQVRNNNVG